MGGLPRRRVMRAELRPQRVADDARARPPSPADLDRLGALMYEAYHGTIDDEGETPDQARTVVQQLFDGEFGTMLWAVSELVEEDGRAVAATLITLWQDRPFVAFSITAPSHRGRGLARAGLQRAMNRLLAGDETELRLVVTRGNAPAERVYERLGFVDEPTR